MSAIEIIKSEFEIVKLSTERDYRYQKSLSYKSFHKVLSATECDKAVVKLTDILGIAEFAPVVLDVNGRHLVCRHASKNIALLTFSELFTESNSSADFLSICSQFKIIILSQMRSIDADEKNEVKRLINFIDSAYEKKIKLFMISYCNLDEIYQHGILQVEFNRTKSRLNEMLSD